MVQIRTLSPAVEIRMPRRTGSKTYRGLQAATVARAVKDYPSPTPQPTPCRLWQGAVDNHGYGTWHRYIDKKRDKIRPHRWVMEQIHGPLRPDQVVMHLCDNPLCFRYDHLRIGTVAENNADMIAKGRYVPRGQLKLADRQAKVVDALVIQRMFMSGLSPRSIAEDLDLPLSTVRSATKGITIAQVRAAPRKPRDSSERTRRVKPHGGC